MLCFAFPVVNLATKKANCKIRQKPDINTNVSDYFETMTSSNINQICTLQVTNIFPSNQRNETCNREIVLTWRDRNKSVWRDQQTKKETEAQRRCQQHAKVCIWWTTTVSFGSSLTELFQTIYGHYFYFILLNLEPYLLSPFPCSSLGHLYTILMHVC